METSGGRETDWGDIGGTVGLNGVVEWSCGVGQDSGVVWVGGVRIVGRMGDRLR